MNTVLTVCSEDDARQERARQTFTILTTRHNDQNLGSNPISECQK